MSDQIYREQLMEHYRDPHNRGKMDNPSKESTKNNPICGDVISMQIKIDQGRIKDIKFDGSACAVSIASSSALTEAVKGLTIEEVKNLSKDDLLEMLGVELTTSRVKCALLPLDTLKGMLEGLEE